MWLYKIVYWIGWMTGQIDEQSLREALREYLATARSDINVKIAEVISDGVLTPAERRMSFIEGFSDGVAEGIPDSLKDTLLPIVEDEARKWAEANW